VKEKIKSRAGFSSGMGDKASEVVEAYAKAFPDKRPVEIWSLIAVSDWTWRLNLFYACLVVQEKIIRHGKIINIRRKIVSRIHFHICIVFLGELLR